MKNLCGIFFILLLFNYSFSQNLNQNEEWCVINILGSKVYDSPSFNSKVLDTLKFGSKAQIENFTDSDDAYEIGIGFSLKGSWIKLKSHKGFVFSSDLSNKDVEISVNEYGQPRLNILGQLMEQTRETLQNKKKYGNENPILETKYYKNGTYTMLLFDGCFNHKTVYKNLTISEIYHQMVSDYGGFDMNQNYWVPNFIEAREQEILFLGEGATTDLKIILEEQNSITITSYDCT